MFIPIGDNVKIKRFPFVITFIILLNIFIFFKIRVDENLLFAPFEIKRPDFFILFKMLLSMFLHSSIFHLFFNMLFLFVFGKSVEEKLGHIRFLFLYIIGGIFSSLFYILFNIESRIPIVGASGAISAIMGSYFVYFFKKKITTFSIIPPFKYQISSWIFFLIWIFTQFINIKSPEIAVLAHLGGFIFGFIASKAFDT
uniref:Rhomboid family intramembrane serine protease n=1 Tax=candidate division WOR-3 bacterium TaxID=2052148 RepID=A0A7C4Y5U7_UNCW3